MGNVVGIRLLSNRLNESKSIILIADGVAYICQTVLFVTQYTLIVILERFEIIKKMFIGEISRDAESGREEPKKNETKEHVYEFYN